MSLKPWFVLWIVSLVVLALSLPARAEWSVEDINKTIEQTNVVVGRGCSGTIISVTEKLVLTNYHCIDADVEMVERDVELPSGAVKKMKFKRYKDVPIRQFTYNGYSTTGTAIYVSEIVAESKKVDLALLRFSGDIPHTYASPILPEGGTIRRGEPVFIVGNPLLEESSLVTGVVSNVNRTFQFPWTGGEKLPMVQFSGGIFGGNSGGALYNDKGQLIGVPAAGYSGATFIGFAIPAHIVRAFLKENCFASVYGAEGDAECREKKRKAKEKALGNDE